MTTLMQEMEIAQAPAGFLCVIESTDCESPMWGYGETEVQALDAAFDGVFRMMLGHYDDNHPLDADAKAELLALTRDEFPEYTRDNGWTFPWTVDMRSEQPGIPAP